MTLRPDEHTRGSGTPNHISNFPTLFVDRRWSGRSFNDGLLRFHDGDTAAEFSEDVRFAFDDVLSDDLRVLAFDWSGRQIVVDRPRKRFGQGKAIVYSADPATGSIEEIATPEEFIQFLAVPEFGDAFQEPLYREFLRHAGRSSIEFGESVGFATPLFLGGEARVENMEVSDSSVYWGINAQIIRRIRRGVAPEDVRFTITID
jgi:hypothetical protein